MSLNSPFPHVANRRIKLFLLTAALALFPALGWSQEYTVTNLGTMGGTNSVAAAVNDYGVVVG
jgi:hypothetical protein